MEIGTRGNYFEKYPFAIKVVYKKVKSFVIGKLKTDIELGNLKILFSFFIFPSLLHGCICIWNIRQNFTTLQFSGVTYEESAQLVRVIGRGSYCKELGKKNIWWLENVLEKNLTLTVSQIHNYVNVRCKCVEKEPESDITFRYIAVGVLGCQLFLC